MAVRQDPRIIVFMICAVALAYWLIVPRAGRKSDKARPTDKHEIGRGQKSETWKGDKVQGGSVHSGHEGLGLGHLDHMHGDAVVKEKENRLLKQQDQISKLKEDLQNAYDQIEGMKDELQAKEGEKTEGKTQNEGMTEAPFRGQRLFHLDLKGAAPKFEYLKNLLPYLQKNGVTGMLIEYEDMFPYEGELSVLKCKEAYTKKQLQELLSIAKELSLVVIPLIQTFGHLEFALKHKEYAKLRETEQITNSVCPLKEQSRVFVKDMIKQVLNLHPDANWIHLGGDEVWNLKTCSKCKESSMSPEDLYQHHMIPLLTFVKELKHNQVTPIIWDDMMRKWDVKSLQSIAKFVEPMIWAYVPDLENYYKFPDGMWKRYFESFPKIWIASSFKGADKPVSNYPPIDHHVKNHLSWLKIIASFPKGLQVVGIAMTGWSRFDHYASLCELLPASIPSLLFCIATLRKGSFNKEIQNVVSEQLGFTTPLPISVTNFKVLHIQQGSFPGSDVFELVSKFEKAQGWFNSGKVREIGWAGDYHVRHNRISIYQLETVIKSANVSIEMLAKLETEAKKILPKYFCQQIVQEWVEDKIKRLDIELKALKENAMKISKKYSS